MKKNLLASIFIIPVFSFAQLPEDALHYSFFPQNGTARNLAIGGAMGSLGGDINSIFVNPAGLGNYKTGEFVFTPGYFLNNNRSQFRGTGLQSKGNNFGLGPIGLVYGAASRYAPTINHSFSIAVTQTASFNNHLQYKGLNNYSSFSEQWAEDVSYSGQSISEVLNNPSYAYGAAPALYTYLVDTFRVNGDLQVKALPEFVLESGKALLQESTQDTRGGLYEIALGYAMNRHDKLLVGGSVGIPVMDYRSTTSFTESDTSSALNNYFGKFTYNDQLKTTGAGINLKLGVIYRPKEYIRLGLSLHTPTYMFFLKDKRSSDLTVNTENYNGTASVSSSLFTNGKPGESKYTMLTPWKIMISGSYVFREIEDVRRQRAFITADIEYVNHQGSRFYSANSEPTADEKTYFSSLGKVIRQQYKGNFNFRLGGELKFNTIMGRIGMAYYSNPYRDAALKANKFLLSGGLGYRNKGFFIDLTYVHAFNKDVNFPYRLADKSNTFASVKNQRGNIVASVGFKF